VRSVGIILLTFLLLSVLSPFLQQASVIQSYTPDVVMLVVIYVGLTTKFEAGVGLALVLGLLKDGFAPSSPVGMYMEIAVLVFLIGSRLSRRLALRGPLLLMMITVIFSLGSSLIELLLGLVFDRSFGSATSGPWVILEAMLPHALITAPFAPLIFWLFDRLDGLTTRKNDSVYMG
jgi:rod shape-determining protein MreD